MNNWKRFGAGVLSAALVLTSIAVVPAQEIKAADDLEINYALGASATVSEQETDYWGADKAVDGIVNRDEPVKANHSRWATNPSSSQTPRILTVDLGVERTFDHFVIEWERTNITNFKIAVADSADGEWTNVYVKDDGENVSSLTSDIKLDEAATGRFVRLTVDGYKADPGSWQSVSLYEFKVLGDVENLSLDATAAANGYEGGTNFVAGNAIDGNDTTRWASPVSQGAHWLSLDYGKEVTLQTFKIHWERKNPTNYRIEKSSDGSNWETVISFDTKPADYRQTIILDEAINTQYVRLYVESFDPTAAPEGQNEVTWATVGIYEFESYAVAFEEAELPANPGEAADAIEVPESIEGTSGTFEMPEVDPGFEISFIGADYEQILDRDLTVYEPLVTKTVQMNFRVNEEGNEENAVDSKAYNMVVTGKYEEEEGDNAKPVVIPELAEWKGAKGGDFSVNKNSRIVVDSKDEAVLAVVAEEFAKDYEEVTGNSIEIVYADSANAGDFFFTLIEEGKGLKEEGYYMNIGESVEIQAEAAAGAYWSTRTILQILTQTGNTIPMGQIRDYPKYEVRGFMLDVARRPFSKKIVDEVAKNMLWYKMNDLQLHLNDNYIFLEDYPDSEAAMTAYEGFRLESDIKADGDLIKHDLTSEDIYWTKDEMRSMIQDYRKLGMTIVPEFDTPAHSLSFTKVRPDLRMGTSGRENDHFNLHSKYNDSLEFVTNLWDEYLKGENPVFDQDTIINVGTDEYSATYTEQFRKFTDDLIAHGQENGNTVRLWGSLTARNGSTPVRSEGVQMNIWNYGWANPKAMYEQGYDLIDMNDGRVYIVPAAGYYYDYLGRASMYNYDPAAGMGVPAGSEQTLGGAYAIWNDMVDKKANGLSEMEIYDRFYDAAPFYASALWGKGDMTFADAQAASEEIGEAPRTNAYDKVESKSDEIIDYDFEEGLLDGTENSYDATDAVNAKVEDGALVLNGDDSYVSTPINRVGPGQEFTFDITFTKPAMPGQILFEADAEYGTFDIRVMADGTLGFTREGYDYSFGYKLPVNQKVTFTIKTNGSSTVLTADGRDYRAVGSYTYEGNLKASGITRASLSLPIERIGSKTNAVNAVIDNISLTSKVAQATYNMIDPSDFEVTTDNEQSLTGKEGPVSLAFDNDETTFWHTQYSPSKKNLPAEIVIDMKEAYDINGFYYLPRQSGANGNIKEYSIYYENEAKEWKPLIENGTWGSSNDEKAVYFTPVNASKVKLVVSDGEGGFGSAAEIRVLEGTEDLAKVTYRTSAYAEGIGNVNVSKEIIDKGEAVTYTAESRNGSTFAGWYDVLGNIVSEEAVYTVVPEENLTLIAKFEGGEEGPVDPSTADKTDLLALIEYAETQMASEDYMSVIPAVRTAFEAVLNEAKAVNEAVTATQAQVDAAYDALLAKVHLLSFIGGDSSDLKTEYEVLNGYDLNAYTEESANALADALAKAKEVLDLGENALAGDIQDAYDALMAAKEGLVRIPVNKAKLEALVVRGEGYAAEAEKYISVEDLNAALEAANAVLALSDTEITQQKIDEAYSVLLQAIFGLREKPNKDALKDLIKDVESIDLSNYTAETASAVKAALAYANEIFADETADQERVDAAVAALNKAVDGLEASTGTPAEGDDKVAAGDKTDNKAASNNTGSKTTNKTAGNTAAKTGDSANPVVPAAAGMVALLGVWFVWKKK